MILKQLLQIESKAHKKQFVKANKMDLLAQKKLAPKKSLSSILHIATASKAMQEKGDTLRFKVVGNSCGFMDSHDDVSLRGSFTRTVNGGAKKAPFLKDHNWTVDGMIGKNMGVSVDEIPIKSLGYDMLGSTEAFVMDVELRKSYDPAVYEKYKEGLITQHSISLQYVDIILCMNDADEKEEFANWNKYIDQVINREEVDEQGYFFGVREQKVIELSAVFRGSNPYTPIIEEEKSDILPVKNDPPNGTHTDDSSRRYVEFLKNL